MKKMSTFALILTGLFLSVSTQAKVWRVNNTPGVSTNFTDLPAALASASVVNDDTLYVEGSSISYSGFTLNKRLVIIGAGYFLSGANSNTGLQANNSSSYISGVISFDSTSSGSTLMGLENVYLGVGAALGSATDNITVTRCTVVALTIYNGYTPNSKMKNWKVNKCYLAGGIGSSGLVFDSWEVYNNIFTSTVDFSNTGNLNNVIRNNVFRSTINIYGGYFANNIIGNGGFNVLNVTIKNNISTGAPAGFAPYVGINNNINNQSDAIVFQGLTGNSTDGQWRLKAGSPAIGAGLTIGAVVSPDCGAFGGPDPYILSGIPNIPTIYTLTVPASIPAGTATMNITVSTKNNN